MADGRLTAASDETEALTRIAEALERMAPAPLAAPGFRCRTGVRLACGAGSIGTGEQDQPCRCLTFGRN